jgi:hypothetical protein
MVPFIDGDDRVWVVKAMGMDTTALRPWTGLST